MPKLNSPRRPASSAVRYADCVAALGAFICLIATGVAGAQSIVKWVDAQGQTHYSDHAPTGQETEAVSVHASRPSNTTAASEQAPDAVTTRSTAAARPTTADNTAAAREAEAEQRRVERREAEAAAQEQANNDVIAKCKQAREIYCNQGADAIRQRDVMRAQIQYADAISARQDRISRGLRPGLMPQPPP